MTILAENIKGPGEFRLPNLSLPLVTFLAAIVFFAAQLWMAAGQPERPVDNDDIVRLTIVRDLLAGQGWYDAVLHRLGTQGTEMHWSRLVDAPLALIILVGNWFAPGAGEMLAAYIWPAFLLGLALTGFTVAVRRIAPQAGLLPGIISGILAVTMAGKFHPGSFDHHNLQQALTIWLIAMACLGEKPERDGWIAGLLAALMLAVGIETLPILALFGCAVGLSYLFGLGHKPAFFRYFGLSLAISAAALFALLVPPSQFLARSCDSYSSFHLTLALCGGGVLALLASSKLSSGSFSQRLAALAVGGACVIGAVALLFPACLSNPLGDLPPLVISQWLNGVQEAQSSFAMAKSNFWQVATVLGMASLALAVALWQIVVNKARAAHLILFATTAAAFAVTLWQFRGYILLVPLSALTLTAWHGLMGQNDGLWPAVKRSLAWASACIFSWQLMAVMTMTVFESSPTSAAAPVTPVENCLAPEAYVRLATMEPGMVLGVTNTGPSVLAFTHHRSLAGPYHRNPQGILRSIEAMIGTPAQAHAIIRETRADYVIACAKGSEDTNYAMTAPQGFLANLLKGNGPAFLEFVQASANEPLRIWRVRKLP